MKYHPIKVEETLLLVFTCYLKIELHFFLHFRYQAVAPGYFVLRISFVQVLHKARYQLPEILKAHLVFVDVATGTSWHTIVNTFALRIAACAFFTHASSYRFYMVNMPAFCQLTAAISTPAAKHFKHLLPVFLRHKTKIIFEPGSQKMSR